MGQSTDFLVFRKGIVSSHRYHRASSSATAWLARD